MKRREFLKQTGIASAGVVGMPYILPEGRLFAPSGSRKVNHVVFCLFSGGVRNMESVHKNDGNLMPNLLNGNESISGDISAAMSNLPVAPLSNPLQNSGTLFKEFRYDNGPTGHFNGHLTAITGQYTDSSLSLRQRPSFPTVFEMYRKHINPSTSALDCWWVSHDNNLYPILNYSDYDGYGPMYAANQISPTRLFRYDNTEFLASQANFPVSNGDLQLKMRTFMDNNFGSAFNPSASALNDSDEAEQLKSWMRRMVQEHQNGLHNNPWSMPNYMTNDSRNIFYAEKIIEEFQPELLVVNMFDVDVCHSQFTRYCDTLRRADWAVGHLWNTIQSTPGMANDTLLIVAPEIGRNLNPNTIIDPYGRAALDHTNGDPMAKEIFCLMAGPSSVVNQGLEISQVEGRSIDIVPTIADALGFYPEVSGILPGQPLSSAWI